MHSYQHTAFERFVIHHNSDLSGECIIVDTQDERELRVPGALLLAFVADFVAGERIARIEQATPGEILGLELPAHLQPKR